MPVLIILVGIGLSINGIVGSDEEFLGGLVVIILGCLDYIINLEVEQNSYDS